MLQTADLNTQITERAGGRRWRLRLSTFFWHLANMIQINVRVQQQPHIPETSRNTLKHPETPWNTLKHPESAQHAARAERRRPRNILNEHSSKWTVRACCRRAQSCCQPPVGIVLKNHSVTWFMARTSPQREKIKYLQRFHAADTQRVISHFVLRLIERLNSLSIRLSVS